MANIIRPAGFTGQTQFLDEISQPITVVAYLWGGGGGGGGSFGTNAGGAGSGGGYSGVTFTYNPGDLIQLAVGGGGVGGTAGGANISLSQGGIGGGSFVSGARSFSGASGGYGKTSGGGGGSGGASVLLRNGQILAVAGGGAGGSGGTQSGAGVNAPGFSGVAGSGIYAGQNGQNMTSAGSGGGGGGGGFQGGNGGAANFQSGIANAGSNGTSYTVDGITVIAEGRNPGFRPPTYYNGAAGIGGQGGTFGAAGGTGTSGYIVLEFLELPGIYVRFNGSWQFVKKSYIKHQGQWKRIQKTYIRRNNVWQPVLADLAPLLLSSQGSFGFQPRLYGDPVPTITSLTWIPNPSTQGGSARLAWTTEFATSVDYTVDFSPGPPSPQPIITQVTWLPNSIQAPGTSTLSWETVNAANVSITVPGGNPNPIGGLPPIGSVPVSFASSGNYTATVTAVSPQGLTANKAANIAVTAQPPPPDPVFTPIIGTFVGPTYSTSAQQDQATLTVTGPGPGIYNYEIISSPAVSFDSRTGSPSQGAFVWTTPGTGDNRSATVSLITPHPSTTLTARITRDGNYTPYTATINVPARQPGERIFPAGQHTFTVPTFSTRLEILLIGGGGGGGTSQPAATGGTGFTSVITGGPVSMSANPGAGGFGTGDHGNNQRPQGGTGQGGNQQNTQGKIGQQTGPGTGNQAAGGLSGFTTAGSIVAPVSTGQGGISGGTFESSSWIYCTSGAGGGSSYSLFSVGQLTPGTVLSISVGAGGSSAGTSGGKTAGRGVDGICIIKWD